MISSVLSNGDEIEINNAYANIGLIASRVWAYDQEDPYRKLNQSLWIQYYKLSEEYEGNNNGTTRSVRDVIPTSRLAQYGDYEYNEEREKMYKSLEEETQGAWLDQREPAYDPRSSAAGTTTNEPWMLQQVEEHFLKLISPNYRFSQFPIIAENINGTEANKSSHQEEDSRKYSMPIPYSVDDNDELQLQERISSKIVKDLWMTRSTLSSRSQRSKLHEDKIKNFRHYSEKRLEPRKYFPQASCSLRPDQGLIMRGQSLYSDTNAPIRKPVFPVLSAEVPEFFPKAPTSANENRRTPIQFFPSSTERSYQDELFPYNRGHLTNSTTMPQNASAVPIAFSHPTVNTLIRAPHQWIQRFGPPIQIQVPGICSAGHPPLYSSIQPIYPAAIIHRPINLHEKILQPSSSSSSSSSGPAPIPVYQRPAELYQETSQRRGKNHQGVDFNNLILLTKNAMKARRNQSKNPQQASSFILESRQPNLKSETDVLQWLDKGYPKRAQEFVTVNSLVSELTNFESKCDCDPPITTIKTTTTRGNEIPSTSTVTNENDYLEFNVNEDSDVPIAKKRLYRDVLANATSTDISLDNLLDRRYDELEQQAMEQYRTSEECLALRYQELERQALEQYKNGSSSSESIRSIRSSTMCGRKDNEENESGGKGNEFTGNVKRCSGFEKGCGSPEDNFTCGRVKGPPVERQVVILRPDNRYASVATVRESTVENCNVTRGTTVITKSLTALNHATFEGVSGNKIKGASGDNTEDRAQSSLHPDRHLLLVSPLNKQSIPISASSISVRASSSRYRKPIIEEGISSGGGDEKVTVLNAPGAQVWLSSFWG